MGAGGQALSRRSFVRAAGAALALASLPPHGALAGWGVTATVAEGEGEGETGAAPFPTVEFGTYPQGADGEVAPIEWYVLEERDGRQLLLSKYVLDAQPYNEEREVVTWETCTLRAWLNADFIGTAFSAEERARIAEVELENPDNPDYGTPGGNDTRDRVFCLSLDEVMGHFGVGRTWKQLLDDLGDEMFDADGNPIYEMVYAEEPGYGSLVAQVTDYAVASGTYLWENKWYDDYGSGPYWWLRSPSPYAGYAACVYADGGVDSVGLNVDDVGVGVRPALWLSATGAVTGAVGEGTTYAPGSFPTVEFGTYPQGADGEVAPIEWYVLEERDGRRLLLNKRVLDAQPYNEERGGVTWETCTLRAWLNADFLEAAFSAEERARIAEAELENPDNPDYGTPGGKWSRDRVFCLSIEEAMGYFGVRRTWEQLCDELGNDWYKDPDGNDDYGKIYAEEPGYEALVARPTDYALATGMWFWDEPDNPYAGGSSWWLRSPGGGAGGAATVGPAGFVFSDGYGVSDPFVGVRPALWLNP